MRLLLVLLLLGGALSGCTGPAQPRRVVVGAYPFAWLVRQLVGQAVPVVDLAKPGVEPHDLELTPRQVAEAQEGLVLRLGGFQAAVDDLGGTDLWRAPGLRPIEHEGVRDPHVWLDPVRMKAIAVYVDRVLQRELGPRAGDGLPAVLGELDRLDAELRAELQRCRSREVVTSHAAFAYFAERYALVQRGISGLSPDAEPSPRRLAQVATYARRHHVGTVFYESLVSPKVAEALAREVGARTAVLDPLESVRGHDDYLSVMRRNGATLHAALGCA